MNEWWQRTLKTLRTLNFFFFKIEIFFQSALLFKVTPRLDPHL